MSNHGNRNKRRQRSQRNLESEAQQALTYGDRSGMFYVFDLDTGEKHKGLNRDQADALWQKLPRSFIMPHPQQ